MTLYILTIVMQLSVLLIVHDSVFITSTKETYTQGFTKFLKTSAFRI